MKKSPISDFEENKKSNYDVFGNAMPDEKDYPEFQEEEGLDDSIIDRTFLSNRDTMDEHYYPDSDLV